MEIKLKSDDPQFERALLGFLDKFKSCCNIKIQVPYPPGPDYVPIGELEYRDGGDGLYDWLHEIGCKSVNDIPARSFSSESKDKKAFHQLHHDYTCYMEFFDEIECQVDTGRDILITDGSPRHKALVAIIAKLKAGLVE